MTSHNLLGDALSVLGKRWMLRTADERQVTYLCQRFELPEPVARLLVSRGIDDETVPTFLNPSIKGTLPDPFHLKDMDKAIARLQRALETQEKIAVFGDYDVDGATSSALLKRYFAQLGVPVTVYIPDRILEGYGPNTQALETLRQQGHTLVITVDCGTTAFEPFARAADIGLDVIVLDHHSAEPTLPAVTALVNPNRLDQEESTVRHCAAVGIVFLTLVALQKNLRESGYFQGKPAPDLLSYLDLVATGTVCDVVPLMGLNRAFVKQGLKVFANRHNQGLTALADVAGIDSYPSAYQLGFLIGPRINAGGRVGTSGLGAELLSCEDPQRCQVIAHQLNAYNEERKAVEAAVLHEATAQATAILAQGEDVPILILASRDWHPGVIGIVAGRLKDQFNKPTMVIAVDEQGVGKGSARSVVGLDIGHLIHGAKQAGHLVAGGGHAMAGGLTIEMTSLEAFRTFCRERIERAMAKDGLDLTPSLKIDARLAAGGASLSLLERFEQLAPYGQGNPTPRFLFDELSLVKADIVGANHIRCIFTDFAKSGQLSGISFKSVGTPLGDLLLNARGKWFSAVGTLKLDEWNGRRRVQFMLEDLVQTTLSGA